MIFLRKFVDRVGRQLDVFRLVEDSLELVRKFYLDNIEGLDNKAFFLPYTSDELAGVMTHDGGYFLGVFHEGRLVAVSGLDFDAEYGEWIRSQTAVNIALKSGVKLYEYSGLMVDTDYRRAGIIEEMYYLILGYAKQNLGRCYICSVADVSNVNSLANLMKRGFSMIYVTPQNGIFRSVYNVLPVGHIDDNLSITAEVCNCTTADELSLKLASGYVGVGVEKTAEALVYQLRKRHIG